ncbi:MAG: hypothetical protein ACLFUB_05820 [Cyclobacteriaceae bacterium]
MRLQKVFRAGVEAEYPQHLQSKIILTNQLSLTVVLCVILPFSIISALYFPSLTWVVIMGALSCLGVIMLNTWGMYNASRVVLSLVPVCLSAYYNAALSSE